MRPCQDGSSSSSRIWSRAKCASASRRGCCWPQGLAARTFSYCRRIQEQRRACASNDMSNDIAPDIVARIDALLPQTQCTRCGYPGCAPYAAAIAAGEAEINQCPPGGATTIQ